MGDWAIAAADVYSWLSLFLFSLYANLDLKPYAAWREATLDRLRLRIACPKHNAYARVFKEKEERSIIIIPTMAQRALLSRELTRCEIRQSMHFTTGAGWLFFGVSDKEESRSRQH